MGKRQITLRQVTALGPGQVIWDGAVPGFGARRQKGQAIAYVLTYRNKEGRQRWHTIGRHGAPWTPEMARTEAQRLLGDVVVGADPASDKRARRAAATVAELCDQYLAEALAGRLLKRSGNAKKASTLAVDKGRIERHIKPLLGSRKVADVTRDDIDNLLHDIASGKTATRVKTGARGLARVTGGQTAANRVVGLLGAIFTYAIRRRMRLDNPAHGVHRFADRKRDRRLSDEEYKALGTALNVGANHWPYAAAAIKFIALTGWRRGEALCVRWSEIDLARRVAVLSDTKTGRSVRPLSKSACELLADLSRTGELVFPSPRQSGVMTGFRKAWVRIAKLGALPPDVTLHCLRHSFASLAADLGYSEPTIAALIGHQGRSVTSRYLHSADAVLLAAADKVADRTSALMDGRNVGTVLAFRPGPAA